MTQNTTQPTSSILAAIDAMIDAIPDEPEPPECTPRVNAAEMESDAPQSDFSERTLPSYFDGFPERHKNRILHPKDPNDDRAWAWWEAFADGLKAALEGSLIIIYGGHGGGKTQMCMEIARQLPIKYFPAKKDGRFTIDPKPRPALYRKAMEFYNDIRATYNSNEAERDVINRYASASLVVIDEAHQRGEKDFEDRQLTLMIDKRYDAMLPTILVTNLTKKEFYASLSPAVKSRMAETAVGIDANWRTFRTRK